MSARQDKSLHDACGKGQLKKVREILEKGGDVVTMLESRVGFLGYTPLHEAACQGHDDILRLLLIYGGNVDAKANGNYTPLHIAASMDYVKCIKVLLKNNADIRALDDFHKTPYQTAVQHRRKDSAMCLKSAEIIQAAKESPQELQGFLGETSSKDITVKCFDEALVEACYVGMFDSVCMLLVAGATNIRECIAISIKNGHYRVTVLLLICYAAIAENISMLETLLDENSNCQTYLEQFLDQSLPMETVIGRIRASSKSSPEDYTRVAIQLPARSQPANILKILLLSTSCRRESRKVNWSKLSLRKIDESWIDPIKAWVQDFKLSDNKLTFLPQNFLELKRIVRLNLSVNKLKAIPSDIFSLPCLRDLNISSNEVSELPEPLELKVALKSLNVSNNNLKALPPSISMSSLETLKLSNNNFAEVPLCVCEITSLKDLDLSNNRDINYLPDEMGKLRNLSHLDLTNLDQITDPPEKMRQNAEDLVAALRMKLRSCEPYYTMKLMLVGKGGQGKTTLVHRLQDDFTYNENDLTQGVQITDLSIKKGTFYKEFNFKVWDFGGQEDYYATHQCFLSMMSLYLLVWRLIDGTDGVKGLTPWLDNIAARSPGSTVIVVGTHLDHINPEKYGHQHVDHLKNLVHELVTKPRYKDKVFVPVQGICAVSCAFKDPKGRAEINKLRQIIYDTAADLKKGRGPVMGELIPSSFFGLIGRIEKRKMEMRNKNQPPIIRKEEFLAMVKENAQLCKRDILDPHDVRDATVFLRERGIVMHFDDPNEGLSDLYFIDPHWLCTLMARVVTVGCYADLVKEGILDLPKMAVLFKSEDLPFDFYSQYIRLLVRFQVAYLLDESRILVPSKLSEKIPEDVEKLLLPFAPVRRVYKIDYQRIHGFWARFMSRFFFYMKEMIAVDPTRYQKSVDSEHGFSAKFCRSCLHVEIGSRTFSCFVGCTESKTENVAKKVAKKPHLGSAKGSPTPLKSTGSPAKTNSSIRAGKTKGPQGDDLQALFLDPSVKLFSAEELAGDGDDDDVDGIMINYVQVNTAKNANDPNHNNISPGRFQNGYLTKKKKDSVRNVEQLMNLRLPSFDGSRRRSLTKSESTDSSTRWTMEYRKDEDAAQSATPVDPNPTNDEKHPTSDEEHPTTDKGDPPNNENHSADNKKLLQNSTEEKSDMLGQEREVIVKESEDKEIEVQNLSLHEMSIASSTSVEAVENDGNLLSNEKRNQSSIPSRTTSECSSCFRSPTDNLVENDLFSGSGKGHTSSVYQGEDAHSYNSSSDMSDSMSTTQSVSSSDDQTDTESSVRSSTNSFQCFDNGNVTTMPNSAHPPSENPQVLSSSEGAAKVEKCPEMMMLENTHGSFADSTASDDRKLAGNYDTTSPDAPTQSDLLSQHAASSVEVLHTSDEGSYVIDTSPKPADPNPETTSVKGDVTAVNPTLVDTQNTVTGIGLADVIGTKANVTDTKSDITNSYPDVTDVGIDVTDGNPEVTDTQPNVRGKGPDDPKTNHDVTDPNINVTDPNINVHFVRNSEKSDTSTTYTDGSRNSVASRTSRSGSQSSTPDQESVLAGISPDQESVPAGISSCAPSASTHHDHCRTTGDSSTTEHLQQSEPEDGESESPSQATNVETEKCTLCKENVPVNELVTIPLDVAELIERKLLLCWRSGICFNHPNLFLAVCHRPLSNTVVVESAVSPSPLGRRLLTFVVDHLDTLIKEWYPGLLLSYGAEPTVRRLIPCRLCEKSGIPKPHVFTFDFCVTHYSMGNFVKCPRHEVSIQDIAPDVVLQDIDADLLLDEEEIEYETTDANKIGDGAFGKVYRGSCRGKDAAIKEYLTPTGEEDAMKRYCEVRKELNVLRRVGQHPYLINLIGVCLRPFRLVLELAVQGSLATALFNPNFLFDRVVVYRMIYQVAEALSFLHSLNVIYRDLKAENVLVMSYNEKDDANIKLTDFGTATFQFSEGLLALEGTPGYHAPEMLEEFSKRTGYDSKVDVFSLAMLIYGFITRRQPFYNINSSAEINRLISSGKKPDYDDVIAARIGLFTLTLLMEKCMHYNPYMRPNSSVVAAQVRSLPFQILLGVIALPCPQSVRHACVVEATRELWVAVDDKATNVVLVYELSRMCIKKKFTVNRIRSHNPRLCLQVNCMHVTTTSVLIGLRGDLDVVTVHDIATYELKAKIPLPEPVFCLSSNDRYIFLGMSGGVFRVIPITGDGKPETVEVSDSEPISCMVAVDKFLWLTARKCIHIFYTEEGESTRAFELNSVRFNSSNSPVSHAVLSADKTAIWCVSKGDSIVTGWDVAERQKLCEIDCKSVLSRISSQDKPLDPVEVTITCVLPALDTVWIGTGGGMLLILDAQSGELITSMQLFDDHVRTLTLVSGPGPCSTEKCYVVVSGKNLQETALSRGQKVVCRLDQEVIKEAPGVQTPTKVLDKTKRKAKKTTFYRAKSPESDSQKPDVEDGGMNSPRNGGLLLFFEVLPADVLRRVEARS